jgi:hypothetical protein
VVYQLSHTGAKPANRGLRAEPGVNIGDYVLHPNEEHIMVEERITRVNAPGEGMHSHTTVITDEPRRRGGGTLLVVLALLALAALAFVLLSPMSGAEVAKDTAIADAAGEVGAAAGEVGEAAQSAAKSLGGE